MKIVSAFALSAVVVLAFSGTACTATVNGGSKTLTYTDDAKRAYDEALAAYHDKDYESARPLFEEMKKLFPQSSYARLAELRLADIDFAQGKYQDAISSYRGYVATYRTDREVEYARYRLAKALYFDIDDTILLPPAEERDQGTAADSYRELRSFLRAYPHSRYKRDIDYMLEVVTGRLVRHELYVARYYRKKDNYEAAVMRLDYALRTYSGSGLDAEALILKGETLMMLNKRSEAKVAFQSVIDDWGGPFVQRARDYLKEIAAPSQSPPIITRPADPGLPTKPGDKETEKAGEVPPTLGTPTTTKRPTKPPVVTQPDVKGLPPPKP